MTATDRIPRLLIDSSLLVLLTVGSVNRRRISLFKRTGKYSENDFDLLVHQLSNASRLYTLPHVLAEVSNLTDLKGSERTPALKFLKNIMTEIEEPVLSSVRAAKDSLYLRLGLTDAAIAAAAIEHDCTVLTDDLDLYVSLSRRGIAVINFSHLRERAWGYPEGSN
jgi:predicted nucleic acid-binding protein